MVQSVLQKGFRALKDSCWINARLDSSIEEKREVWKVFAGVFERKAGFDLRLQAERERRKVFAGSWKKARGFVFFENSMGSGRSGAESVRRGIRTALFMMIMLGSLAVISVPVFVCVADIAVPWALLSALSCRACDGFDNLRWSRYSFRSSLYDIPLLSIVRSFVIICVYSLCDLPGLYHGPYFLISTLSSFLSVAVLAVKYCLFRHESVLMRISPSEDIHDKYQRCMSILLLSSLLLAFAHIAAAFRTRSRARRKLLYHRVDPEAVLSCKTVFPGYQKVPRSPTPNASKSSKIESEEKRRLIYEERDLPTRMLADSDSLFHQCEVLQVHYKIANGERGLGSLASRSVHQVSKGHRCVTPGRLRIENPLSIHSKNYHLSRSYSNNMSNVSLYAPLLCDLPDDADRAFDSVIPEHSLVRTDIIPELKLEDYAIDLSSNPAGCGREAMAGHERNGVDAVILIHGFGGGVFSWRHVMNPLARQLQCPVVAFDRPGWGLTSRPRRSDWEDKKLQNPYELQSQVKLLFSLCREMGFSSVVLVGHDDGGLLALMAAEKANSSKSDCPVAVKGLVLIGFSPTRDVVPAFAKMLLHTSLGQHMLRPLLRTEISQVANRRAWYDATKLTTDVLDLYKAPLCVEGWDRALWQVSKLSSHSVLSKHNADELLRKVRDLPVLIASGAEDILVPLKSAHILATKLPNSTLIPISGCGHLPHEECPKALLAALLPFVSTLLQVSQQT